MVFNPKQLKTVLANNPKIDLALFNNTEVIFDKKPTPSIIPPKIMAAIINKMVQSIPIIPPAVNKSFN